MKNLYSFFLITLIIIGFGISSISAKTNSSSVFYLQTNEMAENGDFEELLKEADRLYKLKKYDEALAVAKKAADLKPNDFRPKAIAGFIGPCVGS